ncbi:MAG: hypothetical protein HFE45_01075 [Oscillospiraceae bacterium]|jgi:hypothetical protein|nr:hypothetical protein [Oscillospiraceae bacterium]
MEYFHGSVKAGLIELKPYASPFSNLKDPVVYLTTSLNDPDSPGCRFVREKFPQYWKEAQVLDAHGLF